jgi:hypothetical protein
VLFFRLLREGMPDHYKLACILLFKVKDSPWYQLAWNDKQYLERGGHILFRETAGSARKHKE